MITELYQSFMMECIRKLEENPVYSKRLERLKKLTKVSFDYADTLTDVLLELFYSNEEYHREYHAYPTNEEEAITAGLDRWLKYYEAMCRTYVFDVTVDGYEETISRTIQVPHDATLGTLGLAVIESLGGQNYEFYMSHGPQELYPAYYDQKLHFTETDPYETELERFNFGNEPIEMTHSGLTIRIQLREVQMAANIYEPQSYTVLGGLGLEFCMMENAETYSVEFVQNEVPFDTPLDIRKGVEAGVILYQTSFLTLDDSEAEDE